MFQIMWKKITNLADAYRMSVEESEALKLENSSLKKELADASTSDVYRVRSHAPSIQSHRGTKVV
jgi:regulator of replication initiation timing